MRTVIAFWILMGLLFVSAFAYAAAPTMLTVDGSTSFERIRVERLVHRLDFTHEAMTDEWQITIWPQDQFEEFVREHKIASDIAFTSLQENRTYVNEYFLIWASDQDIEFVMGHEAGHLICECGSEDKADAIARAMAGYDDRRLHQRNQTRMSTLSSQRFSELVSVQKTREVL